MAQQTAVEWLVKTLELDTRFNGIMNDVIEQAKAMEKEQIIDFANNYGFDICGYDYERAEQYYTETYNPENK